MYQACCIYQQNIPLNLNSCTPPHIYLLSLVTLRAIQRQDNHPFLENNTVNPQKQRFQGELTAKRQLLNNSNPHNQIPPPLFILCFIPLASSVRPHLSPIKLNYMAYLPGSHLWSIKIINSVTAGLVITDLRKNQCFPITSLLRQA